MAKVELEETAINDIFEITEYFRFAKNVKRGNAVIDLILDSHKQLELFPESGSPIRDEILAKVGFRILVAEDYLTIYIYDRHIDTVTIWHIVSAKSDYKGLLNQYIR